MIVIGGGSAGYAAARTARDSGADVAIVDPGPLGGLCILRGCMPTKTILRSAEVAALMRRAGEFGFAPVEVRSRLGAIVDRKNTLVREFADYRIQQLRDPAFTLYESAARFISPQLIQAGSRHLTARSFILATGSIPRDVPIPGLREAGYLTSDELLDVREQPDSLIVLGGGPVGLELGQFFSRIGTRVTLLQRSLHVLSHLDDDIGSTLEQALREDGMEVLTGVSLLRASGGGRAKTVEFLHQGETKSVTGAEMLQALGRRPNIDGLQLGAAGVKVDEDRVVVDGTLRTSQPHIFAVGDVTNLYDIVHIAIQQGELAGFNACHPHGPPKEFDDRLVTEVIFTDPQVAVVGLSEKACRARGVPYLTASYPFADHGKAMVLGSTRGFVKLLAAPETGRLLGAAVVGPEAGELIHELIAVMYYHGTVQDLVRMPHYHPTLAEILTYPAESLAEQVRRA
ncbi:Dihydrolipoyl dehydrogenase [Nitrospira moscoviensis]|uniref:Dihydrolipoyl dehydrogenase n=1 Tax=Nitrospira moscoviensis TaxID=42253 RepID=A0A0K2GJQ9_NITMO|nr:Dihydrolipoyl dehydrogenase [Nitrospira moscoviensis]